MTRRGTASVLIIAAALTASAVGFSDRYVPAVSDWYTRMAVDYLPDSALRFTPLTVDERAFYVCARSVARRMGGESSIATFASTETAITEDLGDGRKLIQSHVDESIEDGTRLRHLFRCTVREEGTQWVIENLEIDAVNEAPTEFAVRSD